MPVSGIFEGLVIFYCVDGDIGGCDNNKFIRSNIPNMQNRLLIRILFFNNFLLGNSVIYPQFKLNRLILILTPILNTIIIITNRNIMIKRTNTNNILIILQNNILRIIQFRPSYIHLFIKYFKCTTTVYYVTLVCGLYAEDLGGLF